MPAHIEIKTSDFKELKGEERAVFDQDMRDRPEAYKDAVWSGPTVALNVQTVFRDHAAQNCFETRNEKFDRITLVTSPHETSLPDIFMHAKHKDQIWMLPPKNQYVMGDTTYAIYPQKSRGPFPTPPRVIAYPTTYVGTLFDCKG